MFQTDFLSPYGIDENKIVKISLTSFYINVGLDLAILVFCFLVWKYLLWVPIEKLTIPNPASSQKYRIDKKSSVFRVIAIVKAILKDMIGKGEILLDGYGFQYFTYLMFLRRLSLVMAILIITDVCVWIPYCLFFQPFSEFSLITMPSAGNSDFRTFYTIWVAFIILYGMYDLKTYLFIMFMHRQFHSRARVLNNLMTKTLHMEFIGNKFNNILSIKAEMQQYLVEDMQQEDRVLSVLAIPIESGLVQKKYERDIIAIVKEYGVDNCSKLWKLFKKETEESVLQKSRLNQVQTKQLEEAQESKKNEIRSCMIIVSQIETAQKLCQQFEIGRALFSFCPEFANTSSEAEYRVKDSRMIVRWAQHPKDLIWINMGYHEQELFNFVLFNVLCALFLAISLFFIAVTSTDTYIKMPTIIGPAILLTFNSTLRFLISKMVQFERKTLRSEWEIKQFKMITIYLLINVLLGSLVRDTLNLLGLLQTGWGWIELFSLIYKKADGLFYYILILNQVAVSFFISLVKLGDIFLDCLESGLWYEKVTRVKRLAMYGQNDSFRLGENYSVHFIILTVVLLYSVSCPLIHCFGFLYFYTKLYLDTYTITVFHEEESVSNMKLIERVIQSIAFMVSAWIFLTATSLTFSKNYSNSIILYIFFGLVIYYAFTLSKVASLKDPETDYIINNKNIESAIQEWRQAYRHPCGYYSQARPLGSSRISMESSVHNIGFVGSQRERSKTVHVQSRASYGSKGQ